MFQPPGGDGGHSTHFALYSGDEIKIDTSPFEPTVRSSGLLQNERNITSIHIYKLLKK
jgi:hypothetical protein